MTVECAFDWNDFLEHPLAYDDWTIVVMYVAMQIGTAVREKRLELPIEIEYLSAHDEPLYGVRIGPGSFVTLYANESLWHRPESYPMTITWQDARGVVGGWECRALSASRA